MLTTLLLALSVAANPVLVDRSPVTLPIARRTNFTSVHNLLRHDQTRAKFLKAKGAAKAAGLPLQQDAVINEQVDNQVVTYVAAVGVGSPATTFNLLIDTGSSNTWVGAGTPYKKTSTSVQTSNKVSVTYGSGSFSGTEFTDTVTIASGLVIPKQSIGVASTSQGFQGVDGILGIGPVDLTLDTLSPATNSLIPTVTDNLFANGVISANEIGISFNPTTVEDNENGEITWGGTDPSKFTGSISFIPLTTTSPANEFWGINQSVRYGSSTSILTTTAGIVDTGTTLVLLATNGFTKYKSATKATSDAATGLLKLTSANFAALQSLFFTAGGSTFELTANAQIWPRALNTDIGGVAGNIYLIVADLGSNSGEGLDFINGFTFLERFYSVFDTANKRVGFATTPFTTSTVN
ncbi:Polyporopepsin [Psilocybe cubensis]|uniref:Polyporopepsin n=2 Tax=Psilocybe cubensis TaxID=181762 RepID=A0ACB8HEX1_PSICU|nr:Polyporopepsin [Psilocybe cubensis]KAH9486239.1 Polyporopepsin [Psilocybe cubensis]